MFCAHFGLWFVKTRKLVCDALPHMGPLYPRLALNVGIGCKSRGAEFVEEIPRDTGLKETF